ncbi:ComEA family DNA-binding protein [uncultured Methylobacterium sp.]|uniref:ComEA family DNA-binding protein n=1 Tax=uncultured Methylobacterium sp. TaxID=157278 RepID=UPI0035CB89F2
MGDAAEAASDAAGPRAVTLVDLNTGSLSDLNGLRGGGSIGRAIVQRRPYASIDQLLSKRVLSRATYDKIKDQVTVR